MKMNNIILKIASLFANIFNRKDYGERHCINIGISESTLSSKKVFLYNNAVKQRHYDTRWIKSGEIVAIDPLTEPNPHIVILGMSGFGKSTLLKSMLIDISRMGKPAIIFDTHNEHEDLVLSLYGKVYDALYNGINLFELSGASVAERISEITLFFKDVYSLGYIQTTKLSECLWYTYRKKGASSKSDRCIKDIPTIRDLVSEINIFINNSGSSVERNTLMHLKEKLSVLNTMAFNSSYISINDLGKGISSFALASLGSSEIQLIYIHELLRMLYKSMKSNAKEHGLNIYLVLDEAQFLIDNTTNSHGIIKKMVEEGRKYGVGVIIATHITRNIGKQIIANASTLISFYSREPSEVNYISGALSGNDPQRMDLIRKRIREMGQNKAIVISGAIKNPTVVRTPHISQINGFIRRQNFAKPVKAAQVLDTINSPMLYDELKGKSAIEVDRLVEDGRIDKMAVNDNGVSKTWIMKHKNSLSIEHEVSIKRISEKLGKIDIKHYINKSGKGPDLVAYSNNGKIAIEYETGKKSKLDTSKMLESRLDEFNKVIVFVNSNALKFYKDYFEKERIKIIDIKDLDGIIENNI